MAAFLLRELESDMGRVVVGRLPFEKHQAEPVGLSLNRVTPSLIRIGLLCQPQLASHCIPA